MVGGDLVRGAWLGVSCSLHLSATIVVLFEIDDSLPALKAKKPTLLLRQ